MSHNKSDALSLKEIEAAYERFVDAAQKDTQLGLLFLIDPLRALSDAGITLSKPARKKIRHGIPPISSKTTAVYDAIRRQAKPPFTCTAVRLAKSRKRPSGGH